jgi:hypothetical protein
MHAEEDKKRLTEEKDKLSDEIQELTGKKNKLAAAANACKNGDGGRLLAFWLVVSMLIMLFVLVGLLLVLPLWSRSATDSDKFMEFYKWTLSVLLGAFGAWIGAGAAYFFGKENLQESSRSTESAMRIQQELLRRPSQLERIKDMTLTAMNSNFIFDLGETRGDVSDLLAKFKGYWFVPVMEKDTGVLRDIIHAQVFWDPDPLLGDDKTTLQDLTAIMDDPKIDAKRGTKRLHGESFFVKVSANDKISDVYNRMCQKDTEVAIVVDEKGKATHCLSKTELRTMLKAGDST